MGAGQECVAGLVLIWLAIALPVMCRVLGYPEWRLPGQLRGERHRRPGHPEDLPLCRQAAGQAGCPDSARVESVVEPWSGRTSRRGRKKELETEGVACPKLRFTRSWVM
jgi:hypothetical protein